MSWTIDKTIDGISYGHRVWSQQLNKEYSLDETCACKHLHGHNASIKVFFTAEKQLTRGMVTDFKHTNWIKKFLDDYIDHKFILDVNDPWFVNIINAKPMFSGLGILKVLSATQPLNTREGRDIITEPINVSGLLIPAGYRLNVEQMKGPEREFYEGFFLVNFVPTSENLCKWLFDIVDARMSQIGVVTSKITWNETPKSRAEYSYCQ